MTAPSLAAGIEAERDPDGEVRAHLSATNNTAARIRRGEVIPALCGVRRRPLRDPWAHPICPRCFAIVMAMEGMR